MGGGGGGGGAPRSAALRRARPRCGRRLVLGAAPETIAAGSTHAPAPGPPGPPPLTRAPPPPGAALAPPRDAEPPPHRRAGAAPRNTTLDPRHAHILLRSGAATTLRLLRPEPLRRGRACTGIPPLGPWDPHRLHGTRCPSSPGRGRVGGGERRDYISQQSPHGALKCAGAAQAPPRRPKMAARWSSENVVVEFRDAQATAMSVDCLGQRAVLSGRRFLYIVNLDAPNEGHRKISRQSKWDIGAVQWNPHDSYAYYFAASSNQRVDLYKWKEGNGEVCTSLQGHTRVISDLDWAVFEPDLLVTSSVDTYIYIWDIKDTRKPTVSLSAVAGASQVKWNKKNANCLATSHDGDVRIWDKRKPSTAVEYLAAHLSKIHGLDWHPDNEYTLATSSQDNSVRFWDYRQPRKYLNILPCQVPVWKARYTPFSNGLVTVMVPQLRRENSLLLWNVFDLNTPVHTFVGHDDVVLEFQWRKQKEGCKDYQLVTWSRDQTLRMWRIDSQLQRLCANDILDGVEDLIDGISHLPEPDKTLHPQDTEPQHNSGHGDEEALKEDFLNDPLVGKKTDQLGLPQTLQQEFSLINVQIRNVNVEMDAVSRSCTVSVHCGNHRVRMLVMFPVQYPNNAAPSFQFINPTSITASMKAKLLKILKDTSLQKVKRNQSCLEPCLRQLVSWLESVVNQEDSTSSNPYALSNSVTPPLPTFARVSNAYGSYQDSNIPFPRTSGARFCGAGYLVYFTRPMTMHRAVSPMEPTPRSLSALSAYHSGLITPMKIRTETPGNLRLYSGSPTRSEKEQVSISSFYYKERKSRRWKSKREGTDANNRPIKAAGKVIIQDISCLLPVHKLLGELYILNVNNIQETCQKNAASALAVGRRDLVQVWSLAMVATDLCLGPKSDPDLEIPWAQHPFGRQLLESLLAHYSQLHDVQTLAMLCSVFEAQSRLQGCPNSCVPFPQRASNLASHSRYPSFTSSGSCSSMSDPGIGTGGWSIANKDTEQTSTPWCESSPDDFRYGNLTYPDPREREKDQHEKNKRLLDPANTQQFDDFKKCYGEILYRWGLREKRAEVLKFVSCPPDPHKGIEFGVYCSHCRSEVRGTQCAICKGFTFQCAICHVAVRGSSNFCLTCGHGGHTSHMMEWFRTQEVCPTGCGCHCLLESTF
ncbi:GATOR complex protein WDR59 isoform X1 [Pyrgilauda ruficollis]|uniref:GATOR complex protein WDR59 isoform X1 n=3 Tax=Passeridae TaxID=9158 RepID=UPI001B85C727|nr:GATOR complex protein WDR59 isoform X1 [Pyrgilauda ruficollis]